MPAAWCCKNAAQARRARAERPRLSARRALGCCRVWPSRTRSRPARAAAGRARRRCAAANSCARQPPSARARCRRSARACSSTGPPRVRPKSLAPQPCPSARSRLTTTPHADRARIGSGAPACATDPLLSLENCGGVRQGWVRLRGRCLQPSAPARRWEGDPTTARPVLPCAGHALRLAARRSALDCTKLQALPISDCERRGLAQGSAHGM
jgi:hypothetical protein